MIDQNFVPRAPWPLFDQFQQLIKEHPPEAVDTPFKRPQKTIILAISPRVGSTALCSALVHAGLAKNIGEWFNPRGAFPYAVKKRPAPTIEHYISNLVEHTNNDTLICSISWMDFAPIVDNDLVDYLFPNRHYIFIERLNKSAQAVSLYRAFASEKWHLKLDEDHPQMDHLPFDIAQLAQMHHTVQSENNGWKNFLMSQSAPVQRITYESFENDLAAGVFQIFDSLGYDRPEYIHTDYKKLSNEVSHKWAEMLEQYLNGYPIPSLQQICLENNKEPLPEDVQHWLRAGYSYHSLSQNQLFRVTQKAINAWRIRKHNRLAAEDKIWIPRLFDEAFYLQQYPEVRASGIRPYVHFCLFGWYEGRQPMPMFDTDWYIGQYPHFHENGLNPLEHYEKIGQREGCRPCAMFDPRWYLTHYPDVQQAGVDPLVHYYHQGWREGRSPSAEFEAYLQANPAARSQDTNPLIAYMQNSPEPARAAISQPATPARKQQPHPISPVIEMFHPLLEQANRADNLSEALATLRGLPLGDFAMLTLNVPEAYPNLKRLLPLMASEADQKAWTGAAGTTLLQQTVDFVKSVHLTLRETGLDQGMAQRRILDFGMGWGRIIRLMYWLFEPEQIFAVDPMESSIETCRKTNVTAKIEHIDNVVTALPFDEKFDLIYAFSVFTHIAEESSAVAQATLRRHITDDGLFVLTVRPVEYWYYQYNSGNIDRKELDMLTQQHQQAGYSFRPHPNRADDAGGSLYGDCTYSLAYIEQHWPGWKLLKTDRNFSDPLQLQVYLQPV